MISLLILGHGTFWPYRKLLKETNSNNNWECTNRCNRRPKNKEVSDTTAHSVINQLSLGQMFRLLLDVIGVSWKRSSAVLVMEQ